MNEIFRAYSHHEMAPQTVMNTLEQYGIYPNERFWILLQDIRKSDDLTFREFFNALFVYDPEEIIPHRQTLSDGSSGTTVSIPRSAGQNMGLKGKKAWEMSESSREFPSQVRRTNTDQQRMQQARSDADGTKTFSGRKDSLYEDININPFTSGDKANYKNSANVKNILHRNEGRDNIMLTHNQRQMAAGITESGNAQEYHFNIETKLQREQALAALRRLDAGSMTLESFLGKLYDMGIEMAPGQIKRITDNLKAGKLDYKNTVKMLDSTVFQKQAMEYQPSSIEVEHIKSKMIQSLRAQGGHSGLSGLTSLFHRIDENNNGMLSYREFLKGCDIFGVRDGSTSSSSNTNTKDHNYHDNHNNHALIDEELRTLFHALDMSGDGQISIREFTKGLCLPLSGNRARLLRMAFDSIASVNNGGNDNDNLSVDVIMSIFNAEAHPDVLTNMKTARTAKTEFISFLDQTGGGGTFGGTLLDKNGNRYSSSTSDASISFEHFAEYWNAIGGSIEDDTDFEEIICHSFDMQERGLKPRPKLVQAKRTAENKGIEIASDAVQIHGDIIGWNQQKSFLEVNSEQHLKRSQRVKGVGISSTSHLSSNINVFSHDYEGKNDPTEDLRVRCLVWCLEIWLYGYIFISVTTIVVIFPIDSLNTKP